MNGSKRPTPPLNPPQFWGGGNIVFSADQKELEQRFADGEVAYLVAGSDALRRKRAVRLASLRAKLGQAVGVTTLPAGLYGEAKPFLQVEGFLLTAAASQQQSQLAFAFAEFATSEAYQTGISHFVWEIGPHAFTPALSQRVRGGGAS